jgi:hypothetical protein
MTKRKKAPVESDMEDFMHQPNLDQDEHDKWLASRSREQISELASRAAALFRSKEQAGKLAPEPNGDLANS